MRAACVRLDVTIRRRAAHIYDLPGPWILRAHDFASGLTTEHKLTVKR